MVGVWRNGMVEGEKKSAGYLVISMGVASLTKIGYNVMDWSGFMARYYHQQRDRFSREVSIPGVGVEILGFRYLAHKRCPSVLK